MTLPLQHTLYHPHAASISWYSQQINAVGCCSRVRKSVPKDLGREDLAGASITQETLTLFSRKGFLEYCRSQATSVEAHGRYMYSTDYRVLYIDCRWKLSFVWCIFGPACWGWESMPAPLYFIGLFHSSYIHPFPARLERYSYMYSNQSPLSNASEGFQ